MNRGTYHILKQIEWYNKLSKTCEFVELEHWFYNYKVDVYAKMNDGKILVIEIGEVKQSKLDMLVALAGTGKITLIRRLIPNNLKFAKPIDRDVVTDTVFPKDFKWNR